MGKNTGVLKAGTSPVSFQTTFMVLPDRFTEEDHSSTGWGTTFTYDLLKYAATFSTPASFWRQPCWISSVIVDVLPAYAGSPPMSTIACAEAGAADAITIGVAMSAVASADTVRRRVRRVMGLRLPTPTVHRFIPRLDLEGLVPEGGTRTPGGERTMYGTMYGMPVKTTVYLPDDLKRALEVEAAASGRSEAEIIREAIAARVGSVRPAAGFLEGEPFAERVDELLAGFGEAR